MDRDDEGQKLFSPLDDIRMETKRDRGDALDLDEARVLDKARDGHYT